MAEGGEATDDHVPSQRRPSVARRLALGLALAVIGVSVWAGFAWRDDPSRAGDAATGRSVDPAHRRRFPEGHQSDRPAPSDSTPHLAATRW